MEAYGIGAIEWSLIFDSIWKIMSAYNRSNIVLDTEASCWLEPVLSNQCHKHELLS